VIDHPVENAYLGGVTNRQVYQCSWCDEYWLVTTISSAWMGKTLSESIEPVGYDKDAINAS
jgi:hypothetical protein